MISKTVTALRWIHANRKSTGRPDLKCGYSDQLHSQVAMRPALLGHLFDISIPLVCFHIMAHQSTASSMFQANMEFLTLKIQS